MDRDSLFASVRKAILSQPYRTYKAIAAEHGISVPTVQQIAGILRKETGFRRPVGRPLGSGNSGKLKVNQVRSNPTPIAQYEQWLKCKEVATFLGVTEAYARKHLTHYKFGRRIWFRKLDVMAALGPDFLGENDIASDGLKDPVLTAVPVDIGPATVALQIAKPLDSTTTLVSSVELPLHKDDGEEDK
jgi:hypothetical protein